MAGGVHITLIGAACIFSILNMAVTVSENMCTTMILFGQTNYTLHYSSDTHELKKCCCTLSQSDADVSLSISSNAKFFELVFLTNGTFKSLRNETGLSLSNSIQFCGKKSESGLVIITGNREFQVRCRLYTSVIVRTTVNVPLTSTTEESVTNKTTKVASHTATIPDDPTTHNRKITTAHSLPLTTSLIQNGSATLSQNQKSGDDTGFNSIRIWIIIGSGVGVLVIIFGVVMSCLLRRNRKRRSEKDNDVPVSESHPTYCGLTGGDNRVYDHIDSPHQDKVYYNVPENSDYQNP